MRPSRRFARLLLIGFEPEEREEILNDLEELAAERPSGSDWYYGRELVAYALRGGIDLVAARARNTSREEGRRGGMDMFVKDLGYALRALRRSPGFTLMAAAILTVAMGTTAAIWSVVDGVLLDPLPIEEPDRVVSFWLESDAGARGRMTPGAFSDASGLDRVFSSTAAFGAEAASLTRDDGPVFLRGSRVTPSYFTTLGVHLTVGRAFRPEEAEPGGPPVVILGHHVWTQMFGSDPEITRRTVQLDGRVFDVVGVAPPGVYPTHATVSGELPFSASSQDFFVPMVYSAEFWTNRRPHILGAIGRLAPDVDRDRAEERLATLSTRIRETEPLAGTEDIVMTSFVEEVVGDVRFALFTMLAAVGLVLLIAIVNVGALIVLRTEDRRPQLAVRSALGAPRGRLLRQMVLESAAIALLASVGATVVGHFGLAAIRSLVPYQIPRLSEVTLDPGALFVTVLVGGSIAALFGLAPALTTGPTGMAGLGRTRATTAGSQRRLQSWVVGVQAALCVIVLTGAGLLTRSYAELRSVDTGYTHGATWAMSIPAAPDVLDEIAREAAALPGVAATAVTYDHPLERNWGDGFRIEGVERSDADAPTSASLRPFGTGYFETVGIDVVDGRVPGLAEETLPVAYAVVNESWQRTFLPGRAAVGTRIVLPTAQRMMGTDGVFEISGVVRDVRFMGPDSPPSPALYVPLSHFRAGATTLLVRPDEDRAPVVGDVRRIVAAAAPGTGVQDARQLDDILADLLARPRFNMLLLVSFGVLGLVLCGLGSYGLVARVVAMRVREIGIQLALGAERRRVARAVLLTALRPVLAGGLAGVALAVGLGGLIRSLLFGISPTDPVSFAGSIAFVLVVGLLAAVVPTTRAISVDPAYTLRSE